MCTPMLTVILCGKKLMSEMIIMITHQKFARRFLLNGPKPSETVQ